MITQVFPDEFHLNTLDQLLSAIARLNPHVNIKAIVIGLMDRLSSYAARESESDSLEERRQKELEAATRLLQKSTLSQDANGDKDKTDQRQHERPDSGQADSENSQVTPSKETDSPALRESEAPVNGQGESSTPTKLRGIPESIKLYEIFYDQVVNLVNAQRLHIQDTIALLVSLSNLALYVPIMHYLILD